MSDETPEPFKSKPGGKRDAKALRALLRDTHRRLAAEHKVSIDNEAQFFGYCSRIMRSVINDLLRKKNADRRGGGAAKINLNTSMGESAAPDDEPLRVGGALDDLAKVEPRLAQVVEMRYFGGYTEEEVAEALGVTARAVQRDWQKARVLLQSMLINQD